MKKFNPPESAKNNAKKVLEWKEKYGDEVKGMTSVGWNRARQLASGESISLDIVKRMAQFARHEKNSKVDTKFKDKPWKDNGYVAWLGWGGDSGINWAKQISRSEENLNYKSAEFQLLGEEETKKDTSVIEILRVGTAYDRGLKITSEMLNDYIDNFMNDVYGSPLQVNLSHNRQGESAGWIKNIYREGDTLLAEVEWTPLGKEKIQSKQFRFTSAELAEELEDWRTGEKVKNVLVGVALTNIPAMKGMNPVILSEEVKNFINLQNNSMNIFTYLFEKLSKKDKITKSEFAELSEVAETIEDEAVKEEAKEQVEEIKEKVEEEEKQENLSEKGKFVSLSEFQKLQEENKKYQEQVQKLAEENELKTLSEKFDKDLCLDEKDGVSIGFMDDKKDDVVKFLKTLSEEQKETFYKLFEEIKTIDFSVYGGKGKKIEMNEDEQDKKANKLAEEIMKEKKIQKHEALSEAYVQLGMTE